MGGASQSRIHTIFAQHERRAHAITHLFASCTLHVLNYCILDNFIGDDAVFSSRLHIRRGDIELRIASAVVEEPLAFELHEALCKDHIVHLALLLFCRLGNKDR